MNVYTQGLIQCSGKGEGGYQHPFKHQVSPSLVGDILPLPTPLDHTLRVSCNVQGEGGYPPSPHSSRPYTQGFIQCTGVRGEEISSLPQSP